MTTYFCWITAVLSSYQDKIVAGMVNKGYMIGAAAKDGIVTLANKNTAPASLIGLAVYKLEESTATSASKVYEDLSEILFEIKAYYYSVIVSASSDCTWAGANFNIDSPKSDPEPESKPTPNNNLN
jgi:hypothetical protein